MTYKKRETFQTPYDEFKACIGRPFEIIGHTPAEQPEGNESFLICFYDMDMKEIDALPEEIFVGTGWEPSF